MAMWLLWSEGQHRGWLYNAEDFPVLAVKDNSESLPGGKGSNLPKELECKIRMTYEEIGVQLESASGDNHRGTSASIQRVGDGRPPWDICFQHILIFPIMTPPSGSQPQPTAMTTVGHLLPTHPELPHHDSYFRLATTANRDDHRGTSASNHS
jgi:hypothetical protein